MRSFSPFGLVLLAAACLTACVGAATSPPGSAPPISSAPAYVAPLALTEVDDQAIAIAYQALDVAASAADVLVATKQITPGSPRAVAIANGLEGARTWLNIASKAQKTAQADNAVVAFMQAQAALSAVKQALGGKIG